MLATRDDGGEVVLTGGAWGSA
ncbi:hypothetical protein [Corynebacterium kroppenstedtii]|nr:hypothetical protein [Corynebacterium kroppenstedtii]MDN8624193.1 hypothetical protein [Corynebacterium kroppenstedtii]